MSRVDTRVEFHHSFQLEASDDQTHTNGNVQRVSRKGWSERVVKGMRERVRGRVRRKRGSPSSSSGVDSTPSNCSASPEAVARLHVRPVWQRTHAAGATQGRARLELAAASNDDAS